MRSLFIAVAILFSVATAAFAADPIGSYDVEGTNANGSEYSGTVTVTKTGQTYRVIWLIGGTRYTGTAIGNKDFMAITYASSGSTGLALYGAEGGNWKGIWTTSGGTTIGTEHWSRQ